jgi:hypothetical protein
MIAVASFAFITSCSDDDSEDTSKPVIDLHEPADGDTLFIGYDTHLEMDLSDNEKLKSYKVDIHNNFDDHGHTKSTSANEAWTFTKSWDVSGLKNTHIHHHEIVIPTTVNGSPIAKGKYHFMIYCTDEAGNESYVVRSVVIDEGIPKAEE